MVTRKNIILFVLLGVIGCICMLFAMFNISSKAFASLGYSMSVPMNVVAQTISDSGGSGDSGNSVSSIAIASYTGVKTGDMVSIIVFIIGIILLILGVALTIYLCRLKEDSEAKHYVFSSVFIIIGLICMIFSTISFAWATDENSYSTEGMEIKCSRVDNNISFGSGSKSNVQSFINNSDDVVVLKSIEIQGDRSIGKWTAFDGIDRDVIFEGSAGDIFELERDVVVQPHESYEIIWGTSETSFKLLPLAGTTPATIVYNTQKAVFTVSFEENGGAPGVVDQRVNYGDKVDDPGVILDKYGYIFDGWCSDVDCNHIWNFDTNVVTKDMTLYAKYHARDDIEAEFNGDGGNWNGQEQVIVKQTFGEKYVLPETQPVREGYTFIGYTDENGNIIDENTIVDTITPKVYAQWKINSYTLTIHYNYDDTYTQVFDDYVNTFEYGSEYSVESKDVFGCKPDKDVVSGVMPAHDVIYNVVYSARTDLVAHFIGNGGKWDDGESIDVVQIYKAVYTYPESEPVREGYTFSGYADADGNYLTPSTIVLSLETTYYAQWIKNTYCLTINYKYADGTTLKPSYSNLYGYGDSYSETSFELYGYTPDKQIVEGIMPASNVEVTVYYSAISGIKMTFDTNGGEFSDKSSEKTILQTYNENCILPDSEPTYSGHSFVGWYTDKSYQTKVTSLTKIDSVDDKRIYAKWSTDGYELTINYVDSDGVKLADSYTNKYDYGEKYSIESPHINGYTANKTVVSGTMGTEDVEVNVVYACNKYNLVINYKYRNGETAHVSYESEVAYKSSYSVTSPTIIGYKTDMSVVSGVMPANDVSVDVVYSVKGYTIKIEYKYTDGTQAKDTYLASLDYGSSYNVVSPTIPGYTVDKSAITGIMGTEDVEEVVTYTARTMNCTFDANGGKFSTGISKEVIEQTFSKGYVLPTTIPVWTGRIFKGWYTSESYTTEITTDTEVHDLSLNYLYAKWELEVHSLTITYKYSSGETMFDTYTADYSFGSVYYVASPVKYGYNVSQDSILGVMSTSDVSYAVVYTAKQPVFTFDANTGAFSDKTTSKTITETFDAVYKFPSDPVKLQNDFKGWYLDNTEYKTQIEVGDIVDIAEDTTVYAKWLPWLPYATYKSGKLVFYWDAQYENWEAKGYEVYMIDESRGETKPGYVAKRANDVTYIEFDSSYANYRPVNCYGYFSDNDETVQFQATEIVGLENLVTSECTNMQYMFSGMSWTTVTFPDTFTCTKVTTFEGMFETSPLVKMYLPDAFQPMVGAITKDMFKNNPDLELIRCEKDWTINGLGTSTNMFLNDTKLPNFDGSKINGTYAYPNNGYTGYFNSRAYANYYNGVLTFYFDDYGASRSGVNFPMNYKTIAPKWSESEYAPNIVDVKIDKSFADFRPQSCYQWFGLFINDAWKGKTLDLHNLNTSEVVNMRCMFGNAARWWIYHTDISPSYVDFGDTFDTSNVTDMSAMFDCYGTVEYLDLTCFNTSKVKNFGHMFATCGAKWVDLTSFDMSSCYNVCNMFGGNYSVTTIYVKPGTNWSWCPFHCDTDYYMFSGGPVGGNGSHDLGVEAKYAIVDGLNGQPGYFTAKS